MRFYRFAVMLCSAALFFVASPSHGFTVFAGGKVPTTRELVKATDLIVLVEAGRIVGPKPSGTPGIVKIDGETVFRGVAYFEKVPYEMKVLKVLKGRFTQSKIIIKALPPDSPHVQKAGPGRITHSGEFLPHILPFKKGKKYLVFFESMDHRGYEEVSGEKDPWYLEVDSVLKAASEKTDAR